MHANRPRADWRYTDFTIHTTLAWWQRSEHVQKAANNLLHKRTNNINLKSFPLSCLPEDTLRVIRVRSGSLLLSPRRAPGPVAPWQHVYYSHMMLPDWHDNEIKQHMPVMTDSIPKLVSQLVMLDILLARENRHMGNRQPHIYVTQTIAALDEQGHWEIWKLV